jgi:hypothetical protein
MSARKLRLRRASGSQARNELERWRTCPSARLSLGRVKTLTSYQHPATYLNNKRWTDEFPAVGKHASPSDKPKFGDSPAWRTSRDTWRTRQMDRDETVKLLTLVKGNWHPPLTDDLTTQMWQTILRNADARPMGSNDEGYPRWRANRDSYPWRIVEAERARTNVAALRGKMTSSTNRSASR